MLMTHEWGDVVLQLVTLIVHTEFMFFDSHQVSNECPVLLNIFFVLTCSSHAHHTQHSCITCSIVWPSLSLWWPTHQLQYSFESVSLLFCHSELYLNNELCHWLNFLPLSINVFQFPPLVLSLVVTPICCSHCVFCFVFARLWIFMIHNKLF